MKQNLATYLFLSLLLFAWSSGYAQSETETFTSKNAVYLETLGNGGIVSVNYDRIFYQNKKWKIGSRVGIGMHPVWKFKEDGYFQNENPNRIINPTVVTEFTGLKGSGNHHLEIGLGYTYLNQKELDREGRIVNEGSGDRLKYDYVLSHDHFIFSRVGYRYQKPAGGFLFRAGFTPVLLSKRTYSRTSFFEVNAGLSFGWSF